ncbi:hypothetical protein I6A84_15590 [Frankia sp. CNm7]|uniref:Amidohydrolase n=1 Tax=Frankia nepalensis TaxID=1836974 RepID=A0A937RAR9_9ACTN|nr:hypothetical protein [Frankia nepalensis]MBL7500850.1 hypothetical protein [Frankia nepalensis]MBL7509216.1 hypothetical protein [Frankia nepalensis]MBL7519485.1 hypothetical protein [Frankia nepalensis]MBL7627020.1 hypothetical protein [Frankia nepalensis]
MNVEDLILISVDDHLVEPPNMFEGRLPARFDSVNPAAVLSASDLRSTSPGETPA